MLLNVTRTGHKSAFHRYRRHEDSDDLQLQRSSLKIINTRDANCALFRLQGEAEEDPTMLWVPANFTLQLPKRVRLQSETKSRCPLTFKAACTKEAFPTALDCLQNSCSTYDQAAYREPPLYAERLHAQVCKLQEAPSKHPNG